MAFKATITSARDARLKRVARAVAEGERLERESARQHDSHVRRYIAHLFFLIRIGAA